MQNATKLYRVIKAIQGLILVALGVVICVLYNQDGLKNAIGYCVASVVLIYGVLTIGFAYMFQRGIASTDMITGTMIAAVSVFLFMRPNLVVEFIPVVAGSALLIYAVILIIETVLAFKGKAYLRGSIYIFATCCCIALGTLALIYLQGDGVQIVIMIIGIIIILAGLTLSILQLIQPKKDIILQGSTLVTETTPEEIEAKSTKVAVRSSKASKAEKKKAKKDEKIKQIEHKKTDKVKEIEQKTEEKSESKKDDNKKATDEGSNDVIDIEPEDK